MSQSLTEIAKSWMLLASVPDESEMAIRRLTKCDGCDFKGQISPIGKLILKAVNDKANTFNCMSCGCPLAALTIRPGNKCPEGFWPAENISYY